MAHKFDEICRHYIYNPVIFPGENNGIIYIAAKEVLWRPHSMKIFLENIEIMKKKTFRHFCCWILSFKLFHRYIYNRVIFPREDNGIIYIAATDSIKLICHAREVFPGRGFSSGAYIAEKWGLEIFWGKCLKIRRLSDFFPVELSSLGNLIK